MVSQFCSLSVSLVHWCFICLDNSWLVKANHNHTINCQLYTYKYSEKLMPTLLAATTTSLTLTHWRTKCHRSGPSNIQTSDINITCTVSIWGLFCCPLSDVGWLHLCSANPQIRHWGQLRGFNPIQYSVTQRHSSLIQRYASTWKQVCRSGSCR